MRRLPGASASLMCFPVCGLVARDGGRLDEAGGPGQEADRVLAFPDECEEVEQQCQRTVQQLEAVLGEPLQSYF